MLGGVVVPLVTPVDRGGRFAPEPVGPLVETIIDDVDGIFIRGTSGEYPALRSDDADAAVRCIVEAIDSRCPALVGVGDVSIPRTLHRLDSLATLGVDYAAITTPYYYMATQSELIAYFVATADHSPVPIVIYQIPQNTHLSMTVATVLELAEHPNIVGIKDSSGDMFALQEILVGRPAGFKLFQGREQLAFLSMLAGADGIISAIGNLVPALLRQLVRAGTEGDRETGFRLQSEITELSLIFQEASWLPVLKAALEQLGHPVGPPIPPTEPVSREIALRIRPRLEKLGLIGEMS